MLPNDSVQILDHGYLRFIERWGSDERIIEAARMSTDKGFEGWGPKHKKNCPNESNIYDCACNEPGDEKLLRYLYTKHHDTPFEMAGIVIEVQAPIFVFREWQRHRTQSYNEMSARYTPLPNVNYIPSVERLMLNSTVNKQAGRIPGAKDLTVEAAQSFQLKLQRIYAEAELIYQEALIDGVPKELARVHLPVGRYSRMRASANLRNWLAFLTLRMASDAQYEIRQFANAVAQIVKSLFPRTYALFCERYPLMT